MTSAPPALPAARRQHTFAVARVVVQRVVETVAEERAVDWRQMLATQRECPQVASARSLAMAVCVSAGLPMHMVGRAFNRTWQSVDSARKLQTTLALSDAARGDEFIRVLSRAIAPIPTSDS